MWRVFSGCDLISEAVSMAGAGVDRQLPLPGSEAPEPEFNLEAELTAMPYEIHASDLLDGSDECPLEPPEEDSDE